MTTLRGITFRLTLVFVLFAAALLAGGGLLAYANGRQQILDGVESELAIASTEKESALDEWVRHIGTDVEAMSRSPALGSAVQDMLAAAPGSMQGGAAHERVVGELRVRVGGGQSYLRWLVLDPQDGRVLADSDGQEEGTYREDQPYFVNGKVGPFVQNVYFSPSLQAPAMTVSAPVMTAGGRLVAVLAARIDLKEMNAIIQRRTGERQTDDAYLVNTSSLFVTQPRLTADPAILRQGVHTEDVRRCLAHGSGVVLADDYRVIPAITSYTWLATRNTCLIVKVDQGEAFAPVGAFGRSVILVGGIALLAVAALAIAMARSITRPILRLQEGTARFGRGELDVRLPETGSDELGTLAHEFNQMAAALSREQTQLRRRLERMYDLSSDLLCVIDLEGRYKEINPAVEQVLGFSQGELLATHFPELVHPDDREATQAALASLAEGHGVTGLQSRHRRKDGSWRWLLWNATADTHEKLIYAVGRDVTESKRMEEALAEGEKKLRALFETMSEGIVYEDHDGKIISANPAAERLLGLSLDQMQGRTSLDPRWKAIHEDGSPFPGETHSLRVAAMTGKPGHDEIQGIYNPLLGAYTWLSINSTPEFLPGEKTPFRAYAVFRDITERKRAEEALQKTLADLERSNRELEQFAYVASHDLQEPLRMVSSYTQLLARRYADQLDPDAHEFIAFAVDGANRMQRLIQDLLTYSRVATHGRPYEPVDLHQPLGEAIANLQTAIGESGALITNGDLPTVTGDRTQLVQVFQNLIGNAIKFRKKEEPPRVHVSARRQGTEWILSVKDNGMGIDPQHFRRLFVIFQRLHGSHEYAGTGIGLALCRRIITRHGGRIWLESAPGQGSEFFFALTADRPPSPSRGAVS